MKMNWCTVLLAMLLVHAEGAKILSIFPYPGRSHKITHTAYIHELAKRGHDITIISPFPELENSTRVKSILLEFSSIENEVNIDFFELGKMNIFQKLTEFWRKGHILCNEIMKNPEVNALIHSKDVHYDLLIVEALMTECVFGFHHKLKAPVVQFCAFGGTHWIGSSVGNPSPYAHIPYDMLPYSDHMNFWQRLHNTFSNVLMGLVQDYYNLPRQDEVMRKYFTDSNDLPPIQDLIYNTSLLLVNNHYLTNYPKPMVPNFIQVGGIHVRPPKPLPADLKKFLDEAPDGVIYFSFGTLLKSANMPEHKIQSFLKAFSKLKQRVLWKWETDSLPGQPSNVKLGKWLPQSDILAHPKLRLFITHGGLHSMQEAVTYGVPLLGIPIFGDQPMNIIKAAQSGFALHFDYNNVTDESVEWALEAALQPSFRENAKKFSELYKDQPQTPLQRAVFWTEYVIRHKGVPHMRSSALELAWYQYFLLDVIGLLVLGVISILLIIFFMIRALLRICFRKKKDKMRSKKRN